MSYVSLGGNIVARILTLENVKKNSVKISHVLTCFLSEFVKAYQKLFVVCHTFILLFDSVVFNTVLSDLLDSCMYTCVLDWEDRCYAKMNQNFRIKF